mmetsp:Transcript_14236/g.53484  ORF Transcript_14236/g.53484 Transcript_14236/m.53484 type:complete len:203 (+) Transcript_14236:517-1125(+)
MRHRARLVQDVAQQSRLRFRDRTVRQEHRARPSAGAVRELGAFLVGQLLQNRCVLVRYRALHVSRLCPAMALIEALLALLDVLHRNFPISLRQQVDREVAQTCELEAAVLARIVARDGDFGPPVLIDVRVLGWVHEANDGRQLHQAEAPRDLVIRATDEENHQVLAQLLGKQLDEERRLVLVAEDKHGQLLLLHRHGDEHLD